MTWDDFSQDRMRYIYIIFALVGLAFYALHQYFEAVFPTQYGISKKPWFLFTKVPPFPFLPYFTFSILFIFFFFC